MICRDGWVRAVGQTAAPKGLEPPLQILIVVVIRLIRAESQNLDAGPEPWLATSCTWPWMHVSIGAWPLHPLDPLPPSEIRSRWKVGEKFGK
jgi:hypothetical protein